jgi:transcriptional regulator with GAF, ATPase, and Fis domain
MRRNVAEFVYNFFAMTRKGKKKQSAKRVVKRNGRHKRPQKKRREQDRQLAIAYLGSPSPSEIRLDEVIADHIKRVLEATDGNLSLAAKLLGMHRRSLQRYARRTQLRTRRRGSSRKSKR